ncbi:PDZ domain [hydrothermal vent metagenome]|uniref:PDZ domain n=1 Tax=hydrothermal vent metagenome TaxID=652676 RepID=A0A3B1D1A6_9ZZZZ
MDKRELLKFFQWTAFFALGSLFFWPGISLALEGPVHHKIWVKLDPDQKSAQIKDILTVHLIEENDFVLKFYLHGDFWLGAIKIPDNTDFIIEIARAQATEGKIPLTEIAIRKITDLPWPEFLIIEFEYGGKVFNPQNPENAPSADPGIFLSGASYFYPQTLADSGPADLMTFQLTVDHPDDWKVVSQGRKMVETKKGNRVIWEAVNPMEEIFLIANRFHKFQSLHNGVDLYAYLLKPEPELANKYFRATKKYIDFYEKLIGPYPYPKFALIENSLQTGYGMASFTFLGSKIIRFPFILNTSYPHEILHNWWGNSVYIDPENGNWAEGLTAYLSDHLLLDLQGKGNQYRLQQLIKNLNYVNESNDFPLINFKWRTDMPSQAIGYGKMLMMLHMLRLQVGDASFLKALREFYRDRRFRFAGLDDLRISFESASGKDLSNFFAHWTYRKGGPELKLTLATHTLAGSSGHELRIKVQQAQSGPAFPIKLPVAIWTQGNATPEIQMLDMTEKTLTASFSLQGEPGRVLIDPYTEIFRKLDRKEVPPAIGQTYGSALPSRIMPTEGDFPDVLMGYHEFAQSLVKDSSVMTPLLNDDKSGLVPNGSLWIFGRTNAYARRLKPQLENYGVKLKENEVVIDGKSFPWKDHSFVFTLQRPGEQEGSATWVIASSGESIPGLIRKLPHYGKYGVLVFKGKEPENTFKGSWPFQPSGLMKTFHPGKYTLPPQRPLVDYSPD